ncbi:MAG: hypothetical protein ACC645_12465 [Pirellulales bacterium]
MTRYVVPLVMLAFLAGCQGKIPPVNLLAPYGPTRIPPPPTGSYGRPDAYYQPSTQPAPPAKSSQRTNSGVSSRSLSQVERGKPTRAFASSKSGKMETERDGGLRAASSGEAADPRDDTSPVRQASARRVVGSEPPPRIVEPRERRSTDSPELKGMPVNDTTRPEEPERFDPPTKMLDISQLPPATRTVQPSDETRPVSVRSGTPTAAPARLRQTMSDETPDDGWKPRENSRPPLRVAGR